MSLLERLETDGPKRILSLDGGGIRGIISIGFLERIESQLRERNGSPDLLLCDYFDLIVGTSTGAIIAVCIALGMDTATIKNLYLEIGSNSYWRDNSVVLFNILRSSSRSREVGWLGAGLAVAPVVVSERRVGEKRIEEGYAGEQVENAVG